MMKLSDGRVTTLVKQSNLPYDSYITLCGDKIYQANYITSTVTCSTIKREKLWEYKDTSVLNGPYGLTVDKSYTVYVTSHRSNSIVVLAPDGRQGRQLISRDNGLSSPTGIYFDKSKKSLLVTNYHGPVFLYHMC
jgi:DNA-binding beta-propeller fold protein YncE